MTTVVKKLCRLFRGRFFSSSRSTHIYSIVHDNKGCLWLKFESLFTPFRIDFDEKVYAQRYKTLNEEIILKAFNLTSKSTSVSTIIDLTAGLGRDSMLLAKAGATVVMNERNETLVMLLRDAIRRHVSQNHQLTLLQMDSASSNFPLSLHEAVNLHDRQISCYLDPIFPQQTKRNSALVKKESQIFRLLTENDNKGMSPEEKEQEEKQMLKNAWEISNYRIVVKRPLHGPALAKSVPHSVLKSTKLRFDIYLKSRPIVYV